MGSNGHGEVKDIERIRKGGGRWVRQNKKIIEQSGGEGKQ